MSTFVVSQQLFRPRSRRRQRGFSLIELLIVISIIMIILLFAVPKFKGPSIQANETSAVRTLQAVHTAQMEYAARFPGQGFTCSLQSLGPPPAGQPPNPSAADLLDNKVTSGSKDGYTFAIQGCTSAASGSRVVSYQIVATPEVPGTTGIKAFCTDGDGTIRYDPSGNAAACLGGNNTL